MPNIYAAVDSISDLKSLTPTVSGPEGKVCFVRGYNNRKDGGEGYFYWDRGADASQANGGTLIASTVNGYKDGQSKEGIWRRIIDESVEFSWWGPYANGTTDDSASLVDAMADANSRGRPLHLGGNTYGLEPEVDVPADLTMRNGTFKLQNDNFPNNGAYKYVLDCKDNVRLKQITIDQRTGSRHNGRGEGFRISGNGASLHECVCYGERSTHSNETNYTFRPLRADDAELVRCESYQAAGSAFRVKEGARVQLEDCKAINWEWKGFGYDSDFDDAGSLLVDGFYAESNTGNSGAAGFLIDPDGDRVSRVVLRDIEIQSGTANGAKLSYIYDLDVRDIKVDVSGVSNALKIEYVSRAAFGEVRLTHRFKIESETGPVHMDYLYVDHATNVNHGGDKRLTIDHMVSRGCTERMVQMNTDKTNKPDRSCTIRFLDFNAENSTSYVWFDRNKDYPGDAFRLEDVEWGNNVTRFWNLAAGSSEAIKVQRGSTSDLPVFMTDEDPSSKNPASTQYIPTGSKFWHFDAGSGETIYWFWDGNFFLPGPSL